MEEMAQTPESIRIGGASAFWGDTLTSTQQLLERGNVNYLIYDYLAEVTLSIMAGQRMLDPNKGYALDFIRDTIVPHHALITEKKVKIIANAGGVNPLACGKALEQELHSQKSNLKIAVVIGDDVTHLHSAIKSGTLSVQAPNTDIPNLLVTLNAYTGYLGIKKALELGADIVITGRVADSAMVLAILMYTFKWTSGDYHKMAQASLAGHLIECGTQACGGNYTDWQEVPSYTDIGFPIIEFTNDDFFMVDKPANTGGLISNNTVAEQLVYEIGDPSAYILPDVVCDWTQVRLEQIRDRVKVSGAKGLAPTSTLKVAGTYPDGYKTATAFVVYGLDAFNKAKLIATAIQEKVSQLLLKNNLVDFSQYHVDYIGTGATSLTEPRPTEPKRHSEIVLKISATHKDKKALIIFSKELAQASTALAPGLCQLTAGRPKVHPMIKLFTCLIPRTEVQETVYFQNEQYPVIIDKPHVVSPTVKSPPLQTFEPDDDHSFAPGQHVQLIEFCYGRSGDKGDNANIGLIARHPRYWALLKKYVTEEFVANAFRKFLDKPTSTVKSYELPGIFAMNFVLHDVLGDGGFASLRVDGQGKGYAQLLLNESIQIPLAASTLAEL